jgi:hypothetical protein
VHSNSGWPLPDFAKVQARAGRVAPDQTEAKKRLPIWERLRIMDPDADQDRERAIFERMDLWPEGSGAEMQEDMRFLRRRLEEARAYLDRARNHNIQLLRRKLRRGCVATP